MGQFILKSEKLWVYQSALFQTNTTIVFLEKQVLLVDPNWLPEEIEEIKILLESRRGDKDLWMLFTHSDYDHIIGYKAFQPSKVIASQEWQNIKNSKEILLEIQKFDDQYYIQRDYPIVFPKPNHFIQQNGEASLGNTDYLFYKIGGHTACGLLTILPKEGIWIVGDYLCGVEFPYIYHSFKAYEETLELFKDLIQKYPIKQFIAGHGAIAFSKEEVEERIISAKAYLEALKKTAIENIAFPMAELLDQYSFPIIMKDFHEQNLALAKKELNH